MGNSYSSRYFKTEAGKAAWKRYITSEKGRASRRKSAKKRYYSEKGKAEAKAAYEKRKASGKTRVYSKTRNDRLRALALEAYGGETPMCSCCGERHREFLAINHINGCGSAHRREVGSGGKFYYWLQKNGYPTGFNVLCHNCNMSLGFYGYCPHK
jgi:hypothetical protein